MITHFTFLAHRHAQNCSSIFVCMKHFVSQQSGHSQRDNSLKYDTIEFVELFIRIMACLIFSPMTTLRTPLGNLDFVTAPETSQVHNFNNLSVYIRKARREQRLLALYFHNYHCRDKSGTRLKVQGSRKYSFCPHLLETSSTEEILFQTKLSTYTSLKPQLLNFKKSG